MKSQKRNRSIPKLEELNPSSVIKIFRFIKDLIEEEDLNMDFFNSRDIIFNSEEIYFVEYYIQSYLKATTSGSYFKNWLQHQEQYIDSPELLDSFSEFRTSIDINTAQIIKKIDLNIDLRLSANRSIKNQTILKEKLSIPISYKIPLIIPFTIKIIDGKKTKLFSRKAMDFKHYVIENLSTVLSKEEALHFFNNSFSIQRNYLPPDLLNLKVADKYALGSAVHHIWKYYDSKMFDKDWLIRKPIYDVDKLRIELDKDGMKSNEIDLLIEDYISSPYFNITNRKIKKANKLGFMKVLYNSFPYIREGYQKTIRKKNKISIDEYLKSRISSTIQD